MAERWRIFLKKFKRVLKITVTAIWIVVSILALALGVVLSGEYGADCIFAMLSVVVFPITAIYALINYLLSEHKSNIQQHVHFLLDEGLIVIVSIHADERLTVLSSEKVKSVLKKYHGVILEEDVTKYHDELMDFIHSHGRKSAPFTIVYGPNAKDGIVLSEDLSGDEVIAAIKKAGRL